MLNLAPITHQAWVEARPAISLPAIIRGYLYAFVWACFIVLIGSFLSARPGVAGTTFVGIVVGLLFFLQRTSWAEMLERFAKALTYSGAFQAYEVERVQSIREFKETIARYSGRAVDWDGMDGRAPNPDAIADALAFIDLLPREIKMPSDVYAPGDGEVMFQWRGPGTLIEVGFYGDDTISWFARLPGRPVMYSDEEFSKKTGRQVPGKLTDALHMSGFLKIVEDLRYRKSSWVQRFRLSVYGLAEPADTLARLKNIERQLSQILIGPGAETGPVHAEVTSAMLSALSQVPETVIQIGSLMIVKTRRADGKLVIVAGCLNIDEVRKLEAPLSMKSPEEALRFLRNEATTAVGETIIQETTTIQETMIERKESKA